MQQGNREQIQAVIFDMDGVLIDSEPLWKIAMEAAFKAVGFNLTRKDFEKTVGLRIDEVIYYWFEHLAWKGGAEVVLDDILRRMIALIKQNGVALPGVKESLQFFRERGMKVGLATSSYTILIDAVLDGLGIRSFFDFTHSAEDEAYGKPHPAVYLHTAEKLGVAPSACMVIEDSLNGVIAGKAARMYVVCVPEKTHSPNPKLIIADETHDNLLLLLEKW